MNTSKDLAEIGGDVAFFGPWIGEFGWELMTWQAWCRQQAKKFKKAYACSFPDMEYLYQDFATFIPHRHPKRHLDWTGVDRMDLPYEVPDDVTQQFIPFKEYIVENQDFIKFGRPLDDEKNGAQSDILIHARGINKGGKNYPVENWEKLVEFLNNKVEAFGVVASIGSADDIHVNGTTDCRGMGLQALCHYISQAKLVIGQSSGVMHLASLCGAPHLVWGDSRTYFGQTLEQRYFKTWNPLNTPVYWIYDDNWNPDPEIVFKMVNMHLEPSAFNPVQQARPTLNYALPPKLNEKMTDAIAAGNFFITVTWKNPNDRLEYYWQSRNFPNGDYQVALEHLMVDVKEHFSKKEHKPDETEVQKGVLGWQ